MKVVGAVVLSTLLAVSMLASTVGKAGAQPAGAETLESAVAAGKVTASIRGTGASSGDAVMVTVTRTGKGGRGPLTLSVPTGTRLQSSAGSVQDMVVASVRGRMMDGSSYAPSTDITVPGAGPVTYVLEVFCADFDKDNPSDGTTFTIGSLDPRIACILREGRALSMEAVQAAVWMHTDRVTFERMNERFAVSRSDWSRAETVVRKCVDAQGTPPARR